MPKRIARPVPALDADLLATPTTVVAGQHQAREANLPGLVCGAYQASRLPISAAGPLSEQAQRPASFSRSAASASSEASVPLVSAGASEE